MKCPKCGSDIGDRDQVCGSCSTSLKQSEEKVSGIKGVKPRKASDWTLVPVSIVVILIALLTPSFAPLIGVWDSDGDGRADPYDAAPHDDSIWATSHSTILLTITSTYGPDKLYSDELHNDYFILYLNGAQECISCIAVNSSLTYTIPCSVNYGDGYPVPVTLTIVAISSGSALLRRSDSASIIVRDGITYTTNLNI